MPGSSTRARRSGAPLKTSDRTLARRNLVALKDQVRQTDWSQGRLTLAELCARYLETIQYQKPKNVEGKTAIIRRIVDDWPTGSATQVGRIRPSEADLWLSRYSFGAASRNLYISCLKEVFALAVRDRVISLSPVVHLCSVRRATPIRLTPTFEQFKAIIADVRAQRFNADAAESADFLEFMRLAGLGQAEAGSLMRADIDFEAGPFHYFPTQNEPCPR